MALIDAHQLSSLHQKKPKVNRCLVFLKQKNKMVLPNPYRLASFSAHYSKTETPLIILPFPVKALTDYDLLLILLFSHPNTEPFQDNRNAFCVKLSFFSASEHELPECPGGQRADSCSRSSVTSKTREVIHPLYLTLVSATS